MPAVYSDGSTGAKAEFVPPLRRRMAADVGETPLDPERSVFVPNFEFLAIVAAVIVSSTGIVTEARADAGDDSERPKNVLFIAVDDLNDWVSSLGGHPQCRTPNIDRLAARGVLFTRAYCSAPACNPSRASLMTGVRPSTSGVYHNNQPWRQSPRLRSALTLPQHFAKAGYVAESGGKIYHGAYPHAESWSARFPRPRDPVPSGRPLNGIKNAAHFDWGPVAVSDGAMGDAKVVDWAETFLRKKHDAPFFLAVGLYRPHLPWYVPEKYFAAHPPETVTLPRVPEDDLEDVPAAGRKMARPRGDHRRVTQTNNWRRAVSGYLASVAFADAMVGRLLAALDASEYGKNTIIVLWGDHGWHLGEKEHWRKFALWEEATRVPLIVAAPGVTTAGTRCARTVSLLDLYPTLLDLAGIAPLVELEGRSLVPLLRNVEAKWDRPVVTTHGRGNHAVRSERWRYIRYADGSEELYDHDGDPGEWRNVAEREDLALVKARLGRWLPARDAENSPREKVKRGSSKKRAGLGGARAGAAQR